MATTMSKEAKKIQKKLSDARAQAEKARHIYQTKLDEAKATLQEVSNQLEFAEDPGTYTELLEQIRLAKGAMQFYRNKLDKAADEPLFNSEEYKDMRARMMIEYNAQISHDALLLADKVHELWDMLDNAENVCKEYMSIIDSLSSNDSAVNYTAQNTNIRISNDMQSGIDPATDRGIYRQFIRLYFECRAKLQALGRHSNNLILP